MRIFDGKNDSITEFFLRLSEEIQIRGRFSFISLSTIHNIISRFHDIGKLNNKAMHRIIDKIWEKKKLGENEAKEDVIFILSICDNKLYKKTFKT